MYTRSQWWSSHSIYFHSPSHTVAESTSAKGTCSVSPLFIAP